MNKITPEVFNEFDEKLYNFLVRMVNSAPKRIGKFVAFYYPDARVRKLYSEFIGVKMGKETYANLGLKVVGNDNLICVNIGNNVSIGPNVTFICESAANNGVEINELEYVKKKLTKSSNIVIEDEVWLGANITIMPGVKIGKCSVIGAGSVVLSDVESFSIYAGVPARRIRDLVTGEKIQEGI